MRCSTAAKYCPSVARHHRRSVALALEPPPASCSTWTLDLRTSVLRYRMGAILMLKLRLSQQRCSYELPQPHGSLTTSYTSCKAENDKT